MKRRLSTERGPSKRVHVDEEMLYRQAVDILIKENGDIEPAIQSLKSLAKNGHVWAAYQIAVMYFRGRPLPLNKAKSRRYAKIAAEKNHVYACYMYGTYLHGGVGGEVDKALAAQMYCRAALQNHPKALYNWAYCLHEGEGVPKNEAYAATLFYNCALLWNMPEAYYKLGQIFKTGKGMIKDLVGSVLMYNLGAMLGHVPSKMALASALFHGEGIVVDKPGAANIYKELADKGNTTSQYNYAVMCMTGDGIPQNMELGLKYCKMSAEGEYPSALHALALKYADGSIGEVNRQKAHDLYMRASLKDHNKSRFQLGKMYEEDGDIVNALKWYKLTVDAGGPCVIKLKLLMTTRLGMENTMCS